MVGPTVSVVVASHDRADALSLCLSALSQQTYRNFEIVVVADEAGMAAVRSHPLGRQIRIGLQETPNIARARNIGLGLSGGEIVAFVDDDAFAEPTWLENLVAPFASEEVAAVGGFVRGRNGISFQWRARSVDGYGRYSDLESQDRAKALHPDRGQAVKLEGCNFAVRARVLRDLGGFDEAFAFLFDDTDVSMRLARAGHAVALAPLAQVYHAQHRSAHRRADRTPRDLFRHGFGIAAYASRYAADPAEAISAFRTREKVRLLRAMVDGRCVPEDIGRLLDRFDRGAQMGASAPARLGGDPGAPAVFRPVRVQASASVLLAGCSHQARTLRAEAARRTLGGERVTLLVLSASTLFHRVRYRSPGYWEQTGGIWGRADREDPMFQAHSFASRVEKETERVALLRGLPQDRTSFKDDNTWLMSAP